jgi:two-component sensor histidine kinase
LHDQFDRLKTGASAEVHWETIHQRSDGKDYPVHETVHYINDEAFPVFVSVVTDISELKRTEEALRKSYQEQRTLLRETNHRIKNNLHLVSTLFEIQAKATEDKQYQQFLQETVNRLHSLMLLHDQLYLAHQQEVLSFSTYVDNLISRLKSTFGVTDIHFKLEIPEIQMSSFAAIHCGLIINELVTNSLKYAFRSKKPGEEKIIQVKLEDLGDYDFRLSVCDNGTGMPEEYLESQSGIGLRLIRMLSKQLSGSIEVENSHGTKYTISLTDQVISET